MTRDDDLFTEVLLVSPDPGLYSFINQGALTVDGIDDVEEMKLTDVCCIIRDITQSTKHLPLNLFFFQRNTLPLFQYPSMKCIINIPQKNYEFPYSLSEVPRFSYPDEPSLM